MKIGVYCCYISVASQFTSFHFSLLQSISVHVVDFDLVWSTLVHFSVHFGSFKSIRSIWFILAHLLKNGKKWVKSTDPIFKFIKKYRSQTCFKFC